MISTCGITRPLLYLNLALSTSIRQEAVKSPKHFKLPGSTFVYHNNQSYSSQTKLIAKFNFSVHYYSTLSSFLLSNEKSKDLNKEEREDSGEGKGEGENAVLNTPLPHNQQRLQIIYTCNVCQTRSSKQFAKRSYTHGVVLVRCPGCQKLHLIADNLGWFGNEKRNVESILAEKGETVKRILTGEEGGGGTIELTLDDIKKLTTTNNE